MESSSEKICPNCSNRMGIRCIKCYECGYDYFKDFDKKEVKIVRKEKYSERFNNKQNEIADGIFNPENWGNRLVEERVIKPK